MLLSMMGVENKMIRILDKNVSDKIAAGEVVERPLSIVKELVENSIDAGADSIVVEIKQGGKQYIRVSDNGSGIDPFEIELAFTRHATSKITEAEDLQSIRTLGFRGEALSSIVAVSRTEVITKTKDSVSGAKVTIEGSVIKNIEPAGCPDGTTIIVTDLFYNTPARQRFMKSDSAESTPIIEFISHVALAYGDIKFRLINNDQILFSSDGKGKRLNTIAVVYGKEIAENLLPLNAEGEKIKLEGYVSSLQISKPTRRNQVFFVNGRIVENKLLQEAVSQAYEDKTLSGRFPVVYLFLDLDPEDLDVNIHPNKLAVKFRDDTNVFDFVSDAIRDALRTIEAVPKAIPKGYSGYERKFSFQETTEPPVIKASEEQTNIKDFLAKAREMANRIDLTETIMEPELIQAETYGAPMNVNREIVKKKDEVDLSQLEIIDTIFGTYILAKYEESMFIIDQHAAHERVFYETFMKHYDTNAGMTQPVLTPLLIDKPRTLSDLNDIIKSELLKMGFTVEEFGNQSYIIKTIPLFMNLSEGEHFVKDYLASITPDMDYRNENRRKQIMSRSCKNAVKARDHITLEEAKALMQDLSKCDNPYTCPHGRPTLIKLSLYDIERMFKRI